MTGESAASNTSRFSFSSASPWFVAPIRNKSTFGELHTASATLDETFLSKLMEVLSDRFIPNREGQDLQASFSLLHDDASPATPSKVKKRIPHDELHFQKSESVVKMLEMLQVSVD